MDNSTQPEASLLKLLYIFFAIVVLQYTCRLLTDYLLIEDSLYYDFWGNKLSFERIKKILEESKKWKWVSYAVLPLLTLIKCFLITASIYIGSFFIKSQKAFGDFFRVVLFAEFIVLLSILIKIIWFGFIHRNYGLEDLRYFSPLSALSLEELRIL